MEREERSCPSSETSAKCEKKQASGGHPLLVCEPLNLLHTLTAAPRVNEFKSNTERMFSKYITA